MVSVASKKPKLCVFIPSFERGGVERVITNLLPYLSKYWEIDLLTWSARKELLIDIPSEVNLIEAKTYNPLREKLFCMFQKRIQISLAVLPFLYKYLESNNIKAIIGFQSSVPMILISKLVKNPPYIVARESNTPSASANAKLINKFTFYIKKRVYGLADRVIANSTAGFYDLKKTNFIPKSKLVLIHNPTVTDKIFRLATEIPDSEEYLTTTLPIILGVGRLCYQKNFSALITAFSLVLKEKEAILFIIGDGEERASLESLANDLNISGSIRFLGFRSNPFSFMKSAAVFVLSSRYEGLPNTLIEAVSIGTPSIAFDSPGDSAEVLNFGEGGWVVKNDDIKGLAEAILVCLKNRNLAQQKAINGATNAQKYRAEISAAKYHDVLAGQI